MRARPLPWVLAAVATALAGPAFAIDDVAAWCLGETGCRVAQETPAGFGQQGQPLQVVELVFPQPPADHWAAGLECRHGYRQFWVEDGSGLATLLLDLCNDGYGAAGVGFDEIELAPNRLVHSQGGGSAWRWGSTTIYRLAPAAILRESWDGYWTLGGNFDQGQWDWTDYSQGYGEWWAPHCDADGLVPDNEGALPEDARVNRYRAIPLLPADSLPAELNQAHLGSCALTLSAETGNGFIVYGDAAAAANDRNWMKIAAVEPDGLIVSVRTGFVVTGGRSWLAEDHLEIWQSPYSGYGDACLRDDSPARQWGIRLSDGAVFAAHGDPAALPQVVGRASTIDTQGGVIVTLHLKLAEPIENLTAVFSKGDGKKGQRWLLASSDLAFGQAETLGHTYAIPLEDMSCALEEGRLEVTRWERAYYWHDY